MVAELFSRSQRRPLASISRVVESTEEMRPMARTYHGVRALHETLLPYDIHRHLTRTRHWAVRHGAIFHPMKYRMIIRRGQRRPQRGMIIYLGNGLLV